MLRGVRPVLIGVCIFLALQLLTFSALETDLALVGAGVLLSVLVVGSWDSWCVAAAALASVLHVALGPASPFVHGALFFGCVFLPRALGGRTRLRTLAAMLLASAGGGVAALLVSRYVAPRSAHFWAANMMGVVLVGSALMPSVDERVVRSLRRLACRSKGTTRWRLLRAIALRRRQAFVLDRFETRAQERIARAWDELIFAARRHIDEASVRRNVRSARIHAYVVALQSATRAAQAAAEVSSAIEDDVLVQLWSEQEHLQASTEAWLDVQGLSLQTQSEGRPPSLDAESEA